LPEALLEPVGDPAGDLALRYARSHGPFTAGELAARYGLGTAVAEPLLFRLTETGRLIEGEFRPGGSEREWIDAGVLRSLRRRSLARLRQEIEPVDADALGRFLIAWHGIGSGRRGLEALLDAIEQLQGAAMPASVLEREILPARVENFEPAMLDTLMAAGEVVWVGVESLGERDGRIALYLTDHLSRLRPPSRTAIEGRAAGSKAAARPAPEPSGDLEGRAADIVAYLRQHGASFFSAIHEGTGKGFPNETVDALWDLVWTGLVTNDTLHPLRAYVRAEDGRTRRGRGIPSSVRGSSFRSRRLVPPTAEGRWSLVEPRSATAATVTEWSAAMAQQLLSRHGIVTRETVGAEPVAGGFSAIYQVLRAMEEAGRIRRGYFVAGLGAAQFSLPAAVDLLRSQRELPEIPRTAVLAATDPANPYGAIVKWPDAGAVAEPEAARTPTRTVGARVILVDGSAAAYLRRGERELLLFPPEQEPRRSQVVRQVAGMLLHLARAREEGRRGMLIADINGVAAASHPAARLFIEEGFAATAMGLQARIGTSIAATVRGGQLMAEPRKDHPIDTPRGGDADDVEREEIRSSNDRDQAAERDGDFSERNRGYDKAVRNESVEDVDPDSADSDIDRDDTVAD
jgi:ATP-dependent Lhr-like helicase